MWRPFSPVAAVLLVAGGCTAAGRPATPRSPEDIPRSTPRDHEGEVVALLNGEPLSWREVAEKMLELDLKTAVDQFARWRLVEDHRKALGIQHTPEELRRRAEVYARGLRQEMGEAAFRAQLEREGLGPEAWLRRISESRLLNEMLTLDKLLRYNSLLEDTLEIDRMMFVDEGEATRFVASARERGWEQAAGEAEKGPKGTRGRFPREVFPKSAPPTDPVLDPWILEAVLKLKPGEFTGVEHSRSNLHYVVCLRNLRKGRAVKYDEVRGEVVEGILADPPSPRDYRQWIDREFAKCRIEYGERKAPPGAPR
jgi:hypothetical protein